MPEGLLSIDDMKVVITAETEKMAAGLQNAQELLSRFSGEGTAKLSVIDTMFGKLGTTVAAARGGLLVWVEAAKVALDIIEKVGERAEKAAKQLGAEDEYNALKEALSGIPAAMSNVIERTDATTKSTAYLKREIDDASTSMNLMSGSASDLAKTALSELTDVIERARHELNRMTSSDTWKTHTIDAEIRRTQQLIENFKARIDSISSDGVSFLERIVGVDSDAAIAKLRAGISGFEAELARLEALRVKAAWKEPVVDNKSADLLRGLEREVETMRMRAAVLGMSAGEAAVWTATERIRIEAAKAGQKVDEEYLETLQKRLRASYAAKDAFDKAREADRKAEQEENRQDKGREGLVVSLERDIAALKRKEAALGDLSVAAKAAETEERYMTMARERGIPITDDYALRIKALAMSYAEADKSMREHQQSLQQMQQYTGVVFKGIETAISRYMQGSQVKFREVVASMLNDLSMLIMKLMVLKPLQDSLSSGLTGGGKGITDFIGGLFADGGRPQPDTINVVGERGPELFVPDQPGRVIPNHEVAGFLRGDMAPDERIGASQMMFPGIAAMLEQLRAVQQQQAGGNSAGLAALLGGISLMPPAPLTSGPGIGIDVQQPVRPAASELAGIVDAARASMFSGDQHRESMVSAGQQSSVVSQSLRSADFARHAPAPVSVAIHNHIDATGAYPESIEDIKRALSDQQQALPSRIIETVADAKERGGI